MTLALRAATPADTSLIAGLIAELAAYEKLAGEAEATPDDLARDLFAPNPRVFAEVAEWNGAPVGFALWFYTYSTFQGRHGIWLEDLYVRPEARGRGIGKALLSGLAQRCLSENLGRLEWWVLDWNKPSIEFYLSQGAVLQSEWTKCRLEGEALRARGVA